MFYARRPCSATRGARPRSEQSGLGRQEKARKGAEISCSLTTDRGQRQEERSSCLRKCFGPVVWIWNHTKDRGCRGTDSRGGAVRRAPRRSRSSPSPRAGDSDRGRETTAAQQPQQGQRPGRQARAGTPSRFTIAGVQCQRARRIELRRAFVASGDKWRRLRSKPGPPVDFWVGMWRRAAKFGSVAGWLEGRRGWLT